jgi:Cu(I)/Ag(I) efflux system protein CusF
MKTVTSAAAVLSAVALGLAACSPDPAPPAASGAPAASEPAADKPMADMPMNAPAAAGPIMGAGKVTAIDAVAGTVMLDHGPIAALNWPSMSMAFTASDPALLAGIAVGDTVSFEIKSQAESTVVTQIHKQ